MTIALLFLTYTSGLIQSHSDGLNYYFLIFANIIVFFILTSYATYYAPFSSKSYFYLNFKRTKNALGNAREKTNIVPKITIHLPCCSEPPELVINTLNRINKINYANFDVIVIDNNTEDDDLWKPVEAHCCYLGDKFKFYHIPTLKGAKAGALNLALTLTDKKSDLIAVVDADYLVEPDFLHRYIHIFNDKKIGYIQTSHDYYNYDIGDITEGAYYCWTLFHKIELPSYTEINSAFTVGTMCILRKKILEEVGGWDEHALTEDSELAVRIHSHGYQGYVFADTVGRGLIPTTFYDMKKQQFRWTAGPVQQFLKHWRVYLGFDNSSQMTFNQRIMEIRHSFSRLGSTIAPLILLSMFFFSYLSTINDINLPVPTDIQVFIICVLISAVVDKIVELRMVNCLNYFSIFYIAIMSGALQWTFISGVIFTLFRRPGKWIRTNKFENAKSFKRALIASRAEILLSTIFFSMGFFLLSLSNAHGIDMTILTTILCFLQGTNFLCSPIAALLLEKKLINSKFNVPNLALY